MFHSNHISHLTTRDQQDDQKGTTCIMVLSWPKDLSVNSGVDKTAYLNMAFILSKSFIADIVASLCNLGPAAQL